MESIVPNEVLRDAGEIVRVCKDELTRLELRLHNGGYHEYSAEVNNLRVRIGRAFERSVNALSPD